jgi:predicted ATP-grasp superfamily ATP-dependent carboligase
MHDITYQNNPPAVVVGLSITGLGTVRALARAGIQVIGVDSNFNQPSARTRYCKKISCSDINKEDVLLKTLIAISKKNKEKPVLFLSTDMSVIIASENRDLLNNYFIFNLPSKFEVRMLMDKSLFADFAKNNGFQIPQTFVVNNLNNIQTVSKNIQFPCIIKPSYRKPTWDKSTSNKVFKIYSREELVAVFKSISHLADRFIVQEFVPGPDSEVYFCLLWYNSFSQPVASFTGKKIMQWIPEFGSTCTAESYTNNDSVLNDSIKLFNSVKYKGIGSVEYKKDSRDGLLKIIEPTVGRADLQSAIAYHNGINIPLMEYCDCLRLESLTIPNISKKVFWINEENLFWVLTNERKRYPRKVWLQLMRGRKYFALFDRSDLAPFFRFLLWIFKFVFNKIINKVKVNEVFRKGGKK